VKSSKRAVDDKPLKKLHIRIENYNAKRVEPGFQTRIDKFATSMPITRERESAANIGERIDSKTNNGLFSPLSSRRFLANLVNPLFSSSREERMAVSRKSSIMTMQRHKCHPSGRSLAIGRSAWRRDDDAAHSERVARTGWIARVGTDGHRGVGRRRG
jgi:hypothetical protein